MILNVSTVYYIHICLINCGKKKIGGHTQGSKSIFVNGVTNHIVKDLLKMYFLWHLKILKVNEKDLKCFIIVKNYKYQISNIGFISLKFC